MLASIQPSMQILIAKQQTYTKDMKVCTCHAWRCNKPPRMTNHSNTSSKMIIIRAPATMNQPALAFQLLSCLQFVLFHLGSFRTGPSPWGTPNHRHPFLRGKTVAHLGYHYHATKDGDGVEQTIPKKTWDEFRKHASSNDLPILSWWNPCSCDLKHHVSGCSCTAYSAELRWNRLTSLECWVMKEPCDLSNQGHQRDQMAFVKGLTGNWETCILTTKKHLKPLDPPA